MPEPDAPTVINVGDYRIKTAELERLRDDGHGEMSERIYDRGEDEGLGHYDHLISNSDELRLLVGYLPTPVLEQLANDGAWPEPYCGVCRALENKRYLRNRILCAVLDWHDTPYREGEARWRAGKKVYERCMKLYELAREIMEERREATA